MPKFNVTRLADSTACQLIGNKDSGEKGKSGIYHPEEWCVSLKRSRNLGLGFKSLESSSSKVLPPSTLYALPCLYGEVWCGTISLHRLLCTKGVSNLPAKWALKQECFTGLPQRSNPETVGHGLVRLWRSVSVAFSSAESKSSPTCFKNLETGWAQYIQMCTHLTQSRSLIRCMRGQPHNS